VLYPYNVLMMANCPDIPTGPVLVFEVYGSPALWEVATDSTFADLKRRTAALLREAGLPRDVDSGTLVGSLRTALSDAMDPTGPAREGVGAAGQAARLANARVVCRNLALAESAARIDGQEGFGGDVPALRAGCAQLARRPVEVAPAPRDPVRDYQACVAQHFPNFDGLKAAYGTAYQRKDTTSMRRILAEIQVVATKVAERCGADPAQPRPDARPAGRRIGPP
jgi:hypothetical protein